MLILSIEDAFLPWLQNTMDMMLPHLPVEPGLIDYGPTDIPPPIYSLEPCVDVALGSLKLNGHSNGVKRSHRGTESVNGDSDTQGWKPKDWVWAKMTTKRRVTPEDWWQDVREIELEFDGRSCAIPISIARLLILHSEPYEPGSICCLQPQTSPEEVEDFLELSGLSMQADTPITLRSRLRGESAGKYQSRRLMGRSAPSATPSAGRYRHHSSSYLDRSP